MEVKNLKLYHWRNYQNLDIEFDSKINLILGDNGSGKTNLAEAIYYLSLGRSWRSMLSDVLIEKESTNASITASVTCGCLKKNIEIDLSKKEKKVQINGKKLKSLSELSNCVNVILFSPSDVPLFMESPSERRNFLDCSISKQDCTYLNSLKNYNNLLNQRNTLLKNENIDLELLSILTSQLVLEGNNITKKRNQFIQRLNNVLPNVMESLSGTKVEAKLVYHPYVEVSDDMERKALEKYASSQKADIKLQHTTTGPHKEDMDFLYNGNNLALYGSQGQNRISVLALKLSPYFLIEKEEEKPIVILDDVSSELDEKTIVNLINFLAKLNQVFITATNLNVIGASIIDVTSNTASRRK